MAKPIVRKKAPPKKKSHPAVEALVMYGGEVRGLAADLGIFRFALKGAVNEAVTLFDTPDLPTYLDSLDEYLIRLSERASRLDHDTLDVTRGVLQVLGRRAS
jgi:hypothetical protein